MAEAGGRQLRRPVTRADVARYAGVSTAVVSYVINNGPKPVALATADRVRRAIDVLGYRPNLSARALRSGLTRMLALVVSDISNPFFADYALQIQMEADKRGYALLMAKRPRRPRHRALDHRGSDQPTGRRADPRQRRLVSRTGPQPPSVRRGDSRDRRCHARRRASVAGLRRR